MANGSPRPWRLLAPFEPPHMSATPLICDAAGETVLWCREECTDVDRANLELIMAAVNEEDRKAKDERRMIEAHAPAFTVHEANRDIEIDPAAGGAAPLKPASFSLESRDAQRVSAPSAPGANGTDRTDGTDGNNEIGGA